MGSGASSAVKSTSRENGSTTERKSVPDKAEDHTAEQSKHSPTRGVSAHHRKSTRVTPLISDTKEVPDRGCSSPGQGLWTEAEEKVREAEARTQEMEAQMAELESQNLDLQDQVCNLERHLEVVERDQSTVTSEGGEYKHTIQAKDQYIQKLERETQTVQEEISKLRRKFKKRLRLMNRQLSEAKQGQSVQMFELQQDVDRLTEDNNKLAGQVNHCHQPHSEGGATSTYVDSRTQVIVELSAKVSEQEAIIMELQQQLAEKDRVISSSQRLETDVHGVTSGTSVWSSSTASNEQSSWSTNAAADKSLDCDGRLRQTFRDDEGQEELRAIAREMNETHKSRRQKPKPAAGKSQVDYRESSGVSRDSGIVAFSKHKTEEAKATSPDSDWADSDSDLEATLTSAASKPSSAVSRTSYLSSGDSSCVGEEEGNTPCQGSDLDPASIRRISAAKMRKAKKNHPRHPQTPDTALGKPPVPTVPRQNGYTHHTDLDSLIQSLDSQNTSSPSKNGMVPVS